MPDRRDDEPLIAAPPDPTARLRSRLDRERLARHEAERIAESTLREVYVQREDLQLLERVARAANEAESVDAAIARILTDLCAYTGWPVADALLVEDGVLRSAGHWHVADPERFAAFRALSRATEFAPGVGLPGRVLVAGEPAWIPRLSEDESFPRRDAALAAGLQSGFAFPVLVGHEVVGVIELFATAAAEPDARVLDVVTQVGVQVGRVIERERARLALEAANGALLETLRDVERSNQDLEAFAYIASHDLQEPLRSISGFVQLLARRYEGKLDPRADEYIAYTVDATARMQALIKDLLRYSRVGREAMRREPVDLAAVLDRTRRSLAQAIADAGAELVVEPLPTVTGDATQLAQLVDNLVGNALKFRSSAPPVVRVRAEREAAAWRILVEDNGIGIPPDLAPKVFDMFQRLHPREDAPGTGIGLAICHKIVERHDGAIGVTARDGGGSCFSFTLPDGPAA